MTGQFSPAFREELAALMRWRRDVRRFRTDPVPEDLLARGFQAFTLAPSVGLSEPWRILRVDSAPARDACLANFRACNARALDGFDGDRAATYSRLKLTGMAEAPIHLAVFWVSILDPTRLARDLDVPDGWRFIGYLCIGWPETEDTMPELERAGWETRSPTLHLETR